MAWIPELICQLVAFMADGTPLVTDEGVISEAPRATRTPTPNRVHRREPDCVPPQGLPHCASSCDEGGCAFDCETDAFLTCARRRRRALGGDAAR